MAIPGVHRHDLQGVIRRTIDRPRAETVDKWRAIYTGFALDFQGKLGAMSAEIQGIERKTRICGPAVTALGPDLSVRRMAINVAKPGDVLVVAAGGFSNRSCFGDGTALRLVRKGLAGAVIDGMTRDLDGLLALGFPTYCRGATPRNFHYPEDGSHGSINVPVTCGGVLVHPGDLIIGDGDGVVVVEREFADDHAEEIHALLEEERSERAKMTQFEEYPVENELRAVGYRFVD